jgi:magnesium chelatase subunit D
VSAPPDAAPPTGDAPPPDPTDALALLAIDPAGLGGALVRGPADPRRDAWLAALRTAITAATPEAPWRRVPLHVTEQRLTGGLDLVATLAAGRPVAERGLLAEADGGVLVLAGAQRIAATTAAHVGAALDTGATGDTLGGLGGGMGGGHPVRIAVVALDEGRPDDDERAPAGLADRLAFHLDHAHLDHASLPDAVPDTRAIAAARALLPHVTAPDDVIAGLTVTAAALGIASLRAPILALRAARAQAARDGRTTVTVADARRAAALVLAPRATRLPPSEPTDDAPEPPPDGEPPPPDGELPPPPDGEPRQPDDDRAAAPDDRPLDDLLVETARAAIPAGLLALLSAGGPPRTTRQPASGRAGPERRTAHGGRPAGNRPGDPRRGDRLDIVATLRTAAPWQPLRRSGPAPDPDAGTARRLEVRRADLRVRRFVHKAGTTLIFAVDASGSAALARLAETKGAVELLLADCYVRRDEVAVIAFRGARPDLLLPPTRALVRAKRALADLPGGGATPLAAALDAARDLALAVRRRGRTPALVVLTDGRANVARDGTRSRVAGEADALAAARLVRAAGIPALVIDSADRAGRQDPGPQRQAAALATALDARYVALPHADARGVSRIVRAELTGA